MKREELLKDLFAELEGKAYNAEYHNYYYKEANQVIRAFFERTFPPSEGAETEETKETESAMKSADKYAQTMIRST